MVRGWRFATPSLYALGRLAAKGKRMKRIQFKMMKGYFDGDRRIDKERVRLVSRGTLWGNPYKIGVDGTRDEVIELYRDHAKTLNIEPLRGYDFLACHCAQDVACHADVLIEMVEGAN